LEQVNSWEWFLARFGDLSNINLTAYKRPQMERRINSFMRNANAASYQDFLNLLSNDKDLFRRFVEYLTINVSEFFRNVQHWEILEKNIIPLLYQNSSRLKVWSAGCSTGEEPYSLAMLFKESFAAKVEPILATDLDRVVLEKAAAGLYNARALQSLPDKYIKKYFNKKGDFYNIDREIKKMVIFKQHDLLKDPYPTACDLILCRNVVIYFTEETKQRLYHKFSQALKKGGVLFIGSTEQIFRPADFGLQSVSTFFYQKI